MREKIQKNFALMPVVMTMLIFIQGCKTVKVGQDGESLPEVEAPSGERRPTIGELMSAGPRPAPAKTSNNPTVVEAKPLENENASQAPAPENDETVDSSPQGDCSKVVSLQLSSEDHIEITCRLEAIKGFVYTLEIKDFLHQSSKSDAFRYENRCQYKQDSIYASVVLNEKYFDGAGHTCYNGTVEVYAPLIPGRKKQALECQQPVRKFCFNPKGRRHQ